MKIKDLYCRYGIKGIFLNVFSKFFAMLRIKIDFKTLYVYDINSYEFTHVSGCRRLEYQDFVVKSKEDTEWLTSQKLEELKRAFDCSDFFAVGCFVDGIMASYGCVSVSTLGSFAQLNNKDGYLFDDYTFPQYRGQGLHKITIMARLNELKTIGKIRGLSIIAEYNKASYTSYMNCGFSRLEYFVQYRFWNGPTNNTLKYGKSNV